MLTALDTLLEGFSERLHPRGWHGRFTVGDHVRVEGGGVKGERSITGRVVRPSDAHPDSHVVIAPHGGGPHVLAKIEHVKLDTPARASGEKQRAKAEALRQVGNMPPGSSRARMLGQAAAQRPRGETTAQQIERKSPGAGAAAQRQREIYRGARSGKPAQQRRDMPLHAKVPAPGTGVGPNASHKSKVRAVAAGVEQLRNGERIKIGEGSGVAITRRGNKYVTDVRGDYTLEHPTAIAAAGHAMRAHEERLRGEHTSQWARRLRQESAESQLLGVLVEGAEGRAE